MAFVNIIDGTSETPSASTPGWQLDMRNRTTLSRAALGVPVRMWVCATNTSTGDTGAVLLVDSTGATVLSLLVNGDSTDTWYFVDGYIPATDAKYDVMIGGTTAGTMKVLAVDVGEYTTPGGGILLSSIGEISMSATGTVASAGISGELSKSIGEITMTAAGTVVTPASPPVYQAQGTVATANSASDLVVSWPTHATDDIGILVVVGMRGSTPYAAPSGWTELSSSPQVDTANALYARLHVFWKRAASGSEGSATVTDVAGDDTKIGQIITFRGCVTSGSPVDVTAGDDTGGTASTSVTIPGGTTTTAQCLVVAICGHSQIDSTSAQFSSWSNGSLASADERADYCTNLSIGYGFGVATGVKETAGSVSATTATLGSSATQGRIMLALKP